MSVKLMKFLSKNDFNDCSDYFVLSIGGNGEVLMYEMDSFFETLDFINKKFDLFYFF